MYLAIDRDSTLYQLLREFLDAYKHRTDIIEQTAESTIQARLDAFTKDINASTDVVEEAIQQRKGEK